MGIDVILIDVAHLCFHASFGSRQILIIVSCLLELFTSIEEKLSDMIIGRKMCILFVFTCL